MTELAIEKKAEVRAGRLRGILSAPFAMGLAAASLGVALQVNFGQYHPIAIELLTVSIAATGLAVFKIQDCSRDRLAAEESSILPASLFVAISFQFVLLLVAMPTSRKMTPGDLLIFRVGIIIAASITPLLLGGAHIIRVATMLLPLIYFLIGLWVLRCLPPPPVDICIFQHDACRALLHGINPYSIDFPNVYANPSKMYDASVVANGRLLFGFPYPPLSLLLTLPGYLAGDFRLAHLAAMSIAGGLIMHARPGRLAALAGTLFLFTPRSFFIIEAGFTEPIVALLFVAVVFAACRGWKSLPILFGLFLASKQYLILAAPLGLLIFPGVAGELARRIDSSDDAENTASKLTGYTKTTRPSLHDILKPWLIAFATAALVTLPLALWNLPAFMKSVAFLQFHQPMRMDSLSYLPRLIDLTGWRVLLALPFLLVIGLLVILLRRLPRTSAAFSVGFALLFLVFFATNKQAFCGYYLTVIAALCCGIATSSHSETKSLPAASEMAYS